MPPLTRVSRRVFTGRAVLSAAAIALPALGIRAQPESRRVTISLSARAAFCHLPLTIAERLGYFRAEGLQVSFSDFASDLQAVQALADGAADVCAGGFEHTLCPQSWQPVYQSFVLQGRAPQIAFGISTKTLPGFRSVAELKGRRVGISDAESSSTMLAHLVLSQAGLKAFEVHLTDIGRAGAALTALRTGQVDAISNSDPLMTLLEQKGEVRILHDTRTLKGTAEVFGGPMPAACLLAPQGFIRKNPETCQALANALVHALKWLQTAGPGDLLQAVPESYLLGDRALYLAAFSKVRESISLDGVMADEAPPTALRALARIDAGLKGRQIDVSKTYTNAFAQRAKERYRA